MTPSSLSLLAATGLLALSTRGRAQTQFNVTSPPFGADPAVNPAPHDDGIAIRRAIAAADAAAPGSVVFFPAGHYEVAADPNVPWGRAWWNASGLFLRGTSGVVLRGAAGARIVFRDRKRHGFAMDACTSITIESLTLTYEKPCHLEGKIVSYAASPTPHYTIHLAPAFVPYIGDPFLFMDRLTSGAVWRTYPFDSVTRRAKNFSSPMQASLEHVPGTEQVRVFLSDSDTIVNPTAMNITVGTDDAAITIECGTQSSEFVPGHMIRSTGSSNLLIQGVTMLRSPFFASQHTFDTNVEYRNSAVIAEPSLNPPHGALLSTNRDGWRFLSSRGSVKVIGCRLERMGDDAVNIHAPWYRVYKVQGQQVFVDNFANPAWRTYVQLHDELEVFHPMHVASAGTVRVASEPIEDPDPDKLGQVFTVMGTPPAKDALLVDYNEQANGFEIRNNLVRDTFARAFYVRGRNGTISDNVIAGTTLGGIVISPDLNLAFKEAGFGQNIAITRNTIHNTGFKRWGANEASTDLGALTAGLEHSQTRWPSGFGHHGLTINNNWIASTRMVGLFLGSINGPGAASGAVVNGNYLLACQLSPAPRAGTARGIDLGSANGAMHRQHVENVTANSNIIDTSPFGAPHPAFSNPLPGTKGTDGTALLLRFSGTGNATGVFSTSFEQEERWMPPLPSFATHYAPGTNWTTTIAGVQFFFTNWGLFGNDPLYDFYRGHIAAFCYIPGGTLRIDTPSGTLSRLEFWAAANTQPGSTVKFNLRVQSKTATGSFVDVGAPISSTALPYPPTFAYFSYALPANTDQVRFVREGGTTSTPFLFLDDIVLRVQ